MPSLPLDRLVFCWMEDAPSFVERRRLPGGRPAHGSQDPDQTRSKAWIPFATKNDGKEPHPPSKKTWNPADGAAVSTSLAMLVMGMAPVVTMGLPALSQSLCRYSMHLWNVASGIRPGIHPSQ